MKDNEPIPEDYYLNGPDEFVPNEEDDRRGWPEEEGVQKNNPPTKWAHEMNPNESTSAPVEKEELKRLHHKLYDEIIQIPNGLDFLRAVNDGIDKLKALQDENARLRSLIEELIGVLEYMNTPLNLDRIKSIIERAKGTIQKG
jgi:hypothetical protein